MKKTIVWFRNDLRLHDQPALWTAANEGIVIPVFIKSKKVVGEATNWWLHHSLIELQQSLQSKGLTLILKSGNALDELRTLIDETKADAVFFNERYEPHFRLNDNKIIHRLTEQGIAVQTFHGNLLLNPKFILNHKDEAYKIFTSYWKRFIQETIPRPLPVPSEFYAVNQDVETVTIDDLHLLSENNWHKKLHTHLQPGESHAIDRWKKFIENNIQDYKIGRDFPSQQSVSKLSAHIANGDISVRALWHTTKRAFDTSSNAQAFLRQLVWREFAYHQLIHYPEMIHTPLRKQFDNFPWQQCDEQFQQWKKGLTGYPLVDAGMRELWATGTVHNRVRMVVASFLVKHLLISWTNGADWFKETLVDFDEANNALGWQWITGCGIDAAPYFRIFNPNIQSEKFDKDGEYIRKWIPELANLPNKHIHKPWEADHYVLDKADIELGKTYPYPIIDHKAARIRALEAFKTTKKV